MMIRRRDNRVCRRGARTAGDARRYALRFVPGAVRLVRVLVGGVGLMVWLNST